MTRLFETMFVSQVPGVPFEVTWFALVAATALFLWAIGATVWLWRWAQRERQQVRILAADLRTIAQDEGPVLRHGLSGAGLDRVREAFERHGMGQAVWVRIQGALVARRDPDDAERYWLSEDNPGVLTEAFAADRRINLGRYASLPNVLTGLGLMCTFIAILIALRNVRMEGGRIEGLEQFIRGLSGKFVSSISALLGATILLLAERSFLHRVGLAQKEAIAALAQVIPRWTIGHALGTILETLTQQSLAFRSFNTTLAITLRQGVAEGIGPTLTRMVECIESLDRFLRAAETSRQESLGDALQSMVGAVERAVTQLLDRLTRDFSTSLTGAARDELGELVRALGGVRGLVEQLQTHSRETSGALNELVAVARTTIDRQLTSGHEQIDALTAAVQRMVEDVQSSTRGWSGEIASTLQSAVRALAETASALQARLSEAVTETADQAAGAARAIVDRADRFTAVTAQRLAELVERQDGHAHELGAVSEVLGKTLERMERGLESYRGAAADAQQVATGLEGLVGLARQASEALSRAANGTDALARRAYEGVERIAEADRSREEAWHRIRRGLEEYQQVFAKVDEAAGQLMANVGTQLDQFTRGVGQGYDRLTEAADRHFSGAAQNLKQSIGEFSAVLDEFREVLVDLEVKLRGSGGTGQPGGGPNGR